MKLFMDVIGLELFLKPLGSVFSESGAIAQLVQGMYGPGSCNMLLVVRYG